MKNKIYEIIKYYGIKYQLRKFQEETFELIDSILEYEYFKYYAPDNFKYLFVADKRYSIEEYMLKLKEHIVEEMSDCLVMISEFKEYYEVNDKSIKEIMEKKIKRQIKRINSEKEKR